MAENERPGLVRSLLASWQLTLDHGKFYHLIPYWIIASVGVGYLVATQMPTSFWGSGQLGVRATILAGLLTFNGIILALCWSAFAKIYEIIGAGAFCAHLRAKSLLSHYLLFVGYCHGSQILAIALTAFSLFSFVLPFELWFQKTVLAGAIASSAYALRQGVATSSAMQDLIWRKSVFDERQRNLQPVPKQA